MAAIRETYTQASPYTATNPAVREDLADIIYNISPTDTPFITMVGKGTCTSTLHEWQTDALAAAGANALLEGADAAAAVHTDTTRYGNYTQISGKTLKVAGSSRAVDSAGYDDAMAYERAKKGLELRNDMEKILIGTHTAKSAGVGVGGTPAARTAGTVQSWISQNGSFGTSGAFATGDGTDVPTNGTDRTYTEALLENAVDDIWAAGGNPDVIFSNSSQKRTMNSFVGRASSVAQVGTPAADRTIFNAVDVYVSDYGELMMVPDRHMLTDEVLVLETDMWSVDYLRDFQSYPLAKDGDSDREQMIVEYTLTAKNAKSSGAIYDLS